MTTQNLPQQPMLALITQIGTGFQASVYERGDGRPKLIMLVSGPLRVVTRWKHFVEHGVQARSLASRIDDILRKCFRSLRRSSQ